MSRYCHSTTFRPSLLCGLIIALLGSLFIYLAAVGLSLPLVNTIAGLLSLYLLLGSSTKVWFWSGFFFGLFWFWWVGLSFIHYHMPWAIPIVILFIATVYGGIFWLIAKTTTIINKSVAKQRKPTLFTIHYLPQGHLSLRSGALFTSQISTGDL